MKDKMTDIVISAKIDPCGLIHTEIADTRSDRARQILADWPGAEDPPPITVVRRADGLHIMDGHHRAVVAASLGVQVRVLIISEDTEAALRAMGYDALEISAGMLEYVDEFDALSNLTGQFDGSPLGLRGTDVMIAIDQLNQGLEKR